MSFDRSPRLGWLDRHPWLAASLLLHALALAALATVAPSPGSGDGQRRVRSADDRQRVGESMERTRRRQLQQPVRELERLQQEMAGVAAPSEQADASTLPDDAVALRRQARELALRMHAGEQQRRAQELARLLKTTPEDALRRVQADPRQGPLSPQASVSELLAHAKALQQARRQREAELARGASARLAQDDRATTTAAGGTASGLSGARGDAGAGGRAGGSGGADGGTGRFEADGGGTRLDLRRYGALAGSEALDPATLRLQQGRRIGPGGPLATRLLIDRWMLVGPFDGPGAASLDDVLPPDLAVDLDAVYEGKDSRLLRWQPLSAPPYPLVPDPRHANAVYYAHTEVHSDREREVWLEIGADDDSKLWLNDELVWRSDPTHDKPWYRRPYHALHERLAQHNLVEARVLVRLRAGRNVLLLKLYNGVDLTFFSVVLAP